MSAKQTRPKNSRPTIGVIVDSMSAGYQTTLWRELKTAAEQADANLIGFVGRELDPGSGSAHQANAIYRLISPHTVDGLILLTGTIAHRSTPEELKAFARQYQPLPMVSIAAQIEGVPSILLDNYAGIRAVMEHLIEGHNAREIAFIRMPEGHEEGDERYRAYRKTLEDYGIPFDPDLVVNGEFYEQADAAIQLLYDERKRNPEAIVVVDDDMAIPVIAALNARGIAVPEDVIITGFDDIEAGRYNNPPLTTVRQPLREQAQQAVQMALAAVRGTTLPMQRTLTPDLVIRESCGCYQEQLRQAAAPLQPIKPDAESITECRADIIAHMAQDSGLENTALLDDFLAAFNTALESGNERQFFAAFSKILHQTVAARDDVSKWQSAVSALRQHVLAFLRGKAELAPAENLIQQARVLIADVSRREQTRTMMGLRRQQMAFRYLGQAINLADSRQNLFGILSREITNIGIQEHTVSLYDQQNPEAETAHLVSARTLEGAAKLPPEGLAYPLEEFLPAEVLPRDRQFTWLVKPLIYGDEQFGFAAFSATSPDETIYDSLAEQISAGLESTKLLQQVEQRSIQLQTASEVARAANSILDQEELLRTVVNLIRDRFDLYYAGIFLSDAAKHWAVLRAGTGEPGAKMLAKNWRLEIGGKSMIGRCVATGEADIQLDVDKAPVHLRNPYLPETKSELALPLISRGDVLGALTIQSTVANAFNAGDIAVLQTMADQIAVAIANARLFEQTQNALLETETLLNVAQLASSTVGIDFALPKILDLVLKATQIDSGLFSIANPETGKLEIGAAQIPDSMLEDLQTKGYEGTLCNLVYTQKQPVIVEDLTVDSPIDASGLIALGYRSYQGVPIESKGEILGTLCTFSKIRISAENTSIHLLRAVGQQVGFAIENIRLFQQTQQALSELEAAQRRYQIQAWSNYNRQRRTGGYRRTPEGMEALGKRPLPEVQDALQNRSPVIADETLTVPLMLRDQPIGAISLQRGKENRRWTPEEVALIQNIGEQFALAAETLRLLDATQRQAARERLVAEITAKLRATNDPQAILQTVTQELRAALNARRAQVLVQPPAKTGEGAQEAETGSNPRGAA